MTPRLSEADLRWMGATVDRQLVGCQRTAHDGTVLFTPDGQGNYDALWTRDFAYMVENAGDRIPPEQIEAAIRYLLRGQREDGTAPDRVEASGRPIYSAGPPDRPLGDPPTDNGAFLVKLVADFCRLTDDLGLFRESADALEAALQATPRSDRGLVYIDPNHPHSPYGFTDTIAKTGELLFSSLLFWEASRALAQLYEQTGRSEAAHRHRAEAERIETALEVLWDPEEGGFFAATVDCRQKDVWGCAYAVACGLLRPTTARNGGKAEAVRSERYFRTVAFLSNRLPDYAWQGQIRHLLRGQYWERTLIPIAPDTYQNGAYWGTASGWILQALAAEHPDQAKRLFEELIQDYRTYGVYECVGPGYRKLRDYVASAVNPYGAVRRLLLGKEP